MRTLLVALSILLVQPISVHAQIDVNIGLPGINIGINVPTYPRLVRVPGYPVYYAPQANWNYFFYDGLYWVYQQDNWYVSSWYDGPWQWVGPENVPLYVLRIPVRYYRRPPSYFGGWNRNEPPRWGDHWGRDWESHRRGWDQWDRRSAPPPALLPTYQQQYSGPRYPRAVGQQNAIRSENYRYEPREPITRQYFRPEGNAGDGRGRPQTPGQIISPSPQQARPEQQPPRQAVPPTQPHAVQPSAPTQPPALARPQPQELRGQPQVDMGQPGQQRKELNQQSPRYQQQPRYQPQQNQQQQNQQQQNQQQPQPSAPPPELRPPQAPGQGSVRPQRPPPQQPMPQAVQPPAPTPHRQPAPADAMSPHGEPKPPRQQPSGPQQDRQVTRQMPPAQPAQQVPGPQGGSPGNEGDNRSDRRGQSNH